MAEKPSGERTEEATPRRKQEARKKGTVAKSTDLTGALALLTTSLALPPVVRALGTDSMHGIRNVVANPPQDISIASLGAYTSAFSMPLAIACIPLFAALLAVGLIVNLGQVGFMLSAEPLSPKLEKINPLSGFKRVFSRRGLMEGLKAMAKMAVFGWIAYAIISKEWGTLVGIAWLTPIGATAVVGGLMHTIFLRISLFWLMIAILDYFFQRKEVDKQIKMTKDELRREMKEQEGSPEIKSAMFQRRRKLLKGGMATKVKEADVIITNPTHFAVAIKYHRNSMHAPQVIAKGQDYLALKIREMAEQVGTPIVENKPLARALYAQCEAGDAVPRDLFMPVAEVLAYVFKSTKRSRKPR